MKKRKLLLLPVFMLLLAGCKTTSSESIVDPVSDSSEISEDVPSSETPSIEDSEDLPTIPVSEDEVVEHKSIEEIRAITEDGKSASNEQKELKYETTGIVTAKFRGANIRDVGPAWNIAIQDGDHALLLYAVTEEDYAAKFKDVNIGDELTVVGNVAAYNGLRELDRIKYVSHKAATPVEPEVLASVAKDDLAGKDSKLVKIEGLKLHSKPTLKAEMDGDRTNININLDIRKDDVKIGTYMHYNIPLEDAQATVEKLSEVTSNSTLTWTGVLGMNNGDFQLTLIDENDWDIEVGEPVVLESFSLKDEAVTLEPEKTYQIKFVTEPFDAELGEVVFATDNEAVATVNEEGLVTAVAAGTANITATVGEEVKTLVVTVEEKEELSEGVYELTVKESNENTNELTPEELLPVLEGYPEGMTVEKAVKVTAFTPAMEYNQHNDISATTGLKLGSSKVDGELTLKMPEGLKIEKVVIEGRSWGKDNATLKINGGAAQTFMNRDSDDYNLMETREFVLGEASETLEFVTTKRIMAAKITLHAGEGSGEVTPDPEPEVVSIADFRAAEDGFEAVLEGVITNIGPQSSYSMEDATGAVAFRDGSLKVDKLPFKVGDKVTATFKKNVFNGLVQAEYVSGLEVEEGEFELTLPKVDLNEVGLTQAALEPYQSRLVKGNLTVKEAAANVNDYGTFELKLGNDTDTVTIRVDNRLPNFAAIKEALFALAVGDEVVIDGATLSWHNVPQLAVDAVGQIAKA